MQENRRNPTSKHAGKRELTPGRGDEITPAHNQRHPLPPVVNRHRELIGPVPVAVAHEEIAALLGWYLRQPTEQAVLERFGVGCKLHTNSAASAVGKSTRAAPAFVAFTADVFAGAFTHVNMR